MWTQEKIQQLIDDKVEEGQTLEYKRANSLGNEKGNKSKDWKSEISKDVSAIANSAGGTIIYGVKEVGHLLTDFDPINRKGFSRERLDQIINNNIRPRINVIIHPVTINDDDNQVIYVVEISQSTTAHQAKNDKYYKRYNTTIQSMKDHEIRDVMRRQEIPDFEVVNARVLLEYGEKRIDIKNHIVKVKTIYFKDINVTIENLSSIWADSVIGGMVGWDYIPTNSIPLAAIQKNKLLLGLTQLSHIFRSSHLTVSDHRWNLNEIESGKSFIKHLSAIFQPMRKRLWSRRSWRSTR